MIKNLILPIVWMIVTLWGSFFGISGNKFLPDFQGNVRIDAPKSAASRPGNLLIRGNREKFFEITRMVLRREIQRRVRRVRSSGALQAHYAQIPGGMFLARYPRGIDLFMLNSAPARR